MKIGKPVLEGWFALSGRRNRKSYFLASLLLVVASIVAFLLIPVSPAPALFVALPLTYFFSAVLMAQRMRDFGWAGGRFAIVYCVLSVGLGSIDGSLQFLLEMGCYGSVWDRLPDYEYSRGWSWSDVFGIFLLVVWLILVFVPGTGGKNKYGPDPIQEYVPV